MVVTHYNYTWLEKPGLIESRKHMPKKNVIIIGQGKSIFSGLIVNNMNIMLINPKSPLPLIVHIKKHIKNKWNIPEFLISIIVFFDGTLRIIRYYGIIKIKT